MGALLRRWIGSSVVLLAGVGCAVVPVAKCSGQIAISMGDRLGEVGVVSTRGMDAYARILKLDEAQKAAMRELCEGATAETRTAADAMRVEMQAFNDRLQEAMKKDGWPKAQELMGEEMPRITGRFQEKRREVEAQFFADVKGMLTEAQLERFPGVERHRRRETGLRGAFGGTADLTEVLVTIGVKTESAAGLAEVLTRYELELDRLLVEGERLVKEQESRLREMMMTFDPEAIEKAMAPMKEQERLIRELSRESAARIGGMLEEAMKQRFEQEIRVREFPRVYKAAHVQKAIDAAMAFSDLDETQREAIKALRAQYEREARPLNDAWARALEARRNAGPVRMEIHDGGAVEMDPDASLKDSKRARTDLDESNEKKLASILREDQRSRLPQKRPERSGTGLMDDLEGAEGGFAVQVMATHEVELPVQVEEKPKPENP